MPLASSWRQTSIDQARHAKETEVLAQLVRQYDDLQASVEETVQLSKDEEMRELCASELRALDTQRQQLLEQIPAVLLPDPAPLPALMSVNAGVGGDEATLCAGMLTRMYQRYAEEQGWTVEIMSQTEGVPTYGAEGLREITMRITSNEGAYARLRWESGVHRVQRVPPNESKGRIQTSTVTIIVLPVMPEEDVALVDPKDVQTEVMRSRGAGGQHVNKTESAVRLTHLPTGISVSMQDSRSQHQNKASAWQILRARLADRREQEEVAARRSARQQEVRSADRSERIRSYNLAAARLTDHRIGFMSGNPQAVLDGSLDVLLDALADDYRHRRIESILAGEGDISR